MLSLRQVLRTYSPRERHAPPFSAPLRLTSLESFRADAPPACGVALNTARGWLPGALVTGGGHLPPGRGHWDSAGPERPTDPGSTRCGFTQHHGTQRTRRATQVPIAVSVSRFGHLDPNQRSAAAAAAAAAANPNTAWWTGITRLALLWYCSAQTSARPSPLLSLPPPHTHTASSIPYRSRSRRGRRTTSSLAFGPTGSTAASNRATRRSGGLG